MDDTEAGQKVCWSGMSVRELVCVEYPGIVRDTERMLATLGGLHNIAQVLEEPNRRLELRLRPEDIFSKVPHINIGSQY